MKYSLLDDAIEKVMSSELSFCKIISANDAGATGGHQAGIYLPRESRELGFDKDGRKGENMERYAKLQWYDGQVTEIRFIYYGKGTRNEYRVTRFRRELQEGELLLLVRISSGEFLGYTFSEEDDISSFLKHFNLDEHHIGLIPVDEDARQKARTSEEKDTTEPVVPQLFDGDNDFLSTEESFIKPAGRHVFTVGRDLIKDRYAALIELVKNSFDADAENVWITFTTTESDIEERGIKLIIEDDGHGMTKDVVVNKWMVPSTPDKLFRKVSPKGRLMQGRKGIGRYAVAVLGDQLQLHTSDGYRQIEVNINWKDFEDAEFLSNVPIEIKTVDSAGGHGTKLTISGDRGSLESWHQSELETAILELKKLIPPVEEFQPHTTFNIYLKFEDFPYQPGQEGEFLKVEPFPIAELYHYRIWGEVNSTDGIAKLKYHNGRLDYEQIEPINEVIQLAQDAKFPGSLLLDFRVFDREPDAIQDLIDRGLEDPLTQVTLGRQDVRRLLNSFNGIGIYRSGFRIQPYGDPYFDWLQLDRERVQNPSFHIGVNQVIGFIRVESEEESNLQEKSARDGLKEDEHYSGLCDISRKVLGLLEQKRFKFRASSGLGRKKSNTDELIEKLFDYSDLREELTAEFKAAGVSGESQERVLNLLNEKEEANNVIAEELKRKIALYEGQITLGKMINVIIHEGRKPLSYFNSQIPLMEAWVDDLSEKYDPEKLKRVLAKAENIKEQAASLSYLFSKIDPLTAKRRKAREDFEIMDVIHVVQGVFQNEFDRMGIKLEIDCPSSITFHGYKQDFVTALANLVENSVYWLEYSNREEKAIRIVGESGEYGLVLHYYDNGPGIKPDDLEDDMIFEPGFTTKSDGTGLGLSIAGEALERNNCALIAEESEEGVHFMIRQRNKA